MYLFPLLGLPDPARLCKFRTSVRVRGIHDVLVCRGLIRDTVERVLRDPTHGS